MPATTTKKAKRNAGDEYHAKLAELKILTGILEDGIQQYDDRRSADRLKPDWSHVGDLEHYKKEMLDVAGCLFNIDTSVIETEIAERLV